MGHYSVILQTKLSKSEMVEIWKPHFVKTFVLLVNKTEKLASWFIRCINNVLLSSLTYILLGNIFQSDSQ